MGFLLIQAFGVGGGVILNQHKHTSMVMDLRADSNLSLLLAYRKVEPKRERQSSPALS